MNRSQMLSRVLAHDYPWDMLIVGGGATGAGIALDAAARGYDVLLVEQSDFGKGTSSRSTKLAHGGVRYLEQGNISLVMEALRERGILRQNAPHLVREIKLIIPTYSWWEKPFYTIGLGIYNLLSGRYSFGSSRTLSRAETLAQLPTVKKEHLLGGVVYYDGQFDDSRLLINLAETAAEQGCTLLNYLPITALTKGANGLVNAAVARDVETGRELRFSAKVVINATGPFCDGLRRMADPDVSSLVAPSQGIHVVFDGSFLRGSTALMIPHTSDGRVLFAIPWHGHTLVGTTDSPIAEPSLEPVPMEEEIEFILRTVAQYLDNPPTRGDILSVFAGIRPLVRAGGISNTASLSRDHTIEIGPSGLLTITGGKWTTYRRMAEGCVNRAAALVRLPMKSCTTRHLRVHGFHAEADRFGHLSPYGSDAPAIQAMIRADPKLGEPLDPALPYVGAEVVWAVRFEMARNVEDFLARRVPALFLDAKAAARMAPRVAELLARELGREKRWQTQQTEAFRELAIQFEGGRKTSDGHEPEFLLHRGPSREHSA